MLGRKFCRPAEEMGFLGSAETAGGGGSEVLLLELSGGLRWTAECLVKVARGLNWAVEAWKGSLLVY